MKFTRSKAQPESSPADILRSYIEKEGIAPYNSDFDLKNAKPAYQVEMERTKKSREPKPVSFLPGHKEAEAEIERRTEEAPGFLDIARRPITKTDVKFPMLKGLETASLAARRGEAAIANPLMAVQRGEFNPLALGGESLKGLTGQRLGETGDVYRQIGVGGPLAAAGGLLSLGGITKGVTSAVGGLSKAGQQIRYGKQIAHGKRYEKVANQIDDHIGSAKKKVSDPYDEYLKIGGKKQLNELDSADASRIFEKMPKELQEAFYEHMKGDNPFTLENLKILRDVSKGRVSSKYWDVRVVDDLVKKKADAAYDDIGKLMRRNRPKMKEVHENYARVMEASDELTPGITSKRGFTKSKQTEGLYKPKADRSKQKAVERIAEYEPKIKDTIDKLIKITNKDLSPSKWKVAGDVVSKVGPTAGILGLGGLGVWGFNKIKKSLGKDDYAGQDENYTN